MGRRIEQELAGLDGIYESLLQPHETLLKGLSEQKQVSYLQTENKHIRDEFRRLNALLNELVESHRTCKAYNKSGSATAEGTFKPWSTARCEVARGAQCREDDPEPRERAHATCRQDRAII